MIGVVLHLTMCLIIVSVDTSAQGPTQRHNFNSNIIQSTESTTANPQENESHSKDITVTNQVKEFSNSTNVTAPINQPEDALLKVMQQEEVAEEYNNILTNGTKWSKNQKNEWNPTGIGVATWYEISLTGRRALYTEDNRAGRGIHPHASTSRGATSIETSSQIGLLLVFIKFILH